MTLGMAEFLHTTIKAGYIRENRKDRCDFIKIKPFCSEKDSVKRMKRQPQIRENICKLHTEKKTYQNIQRTLKTVKK